MFARYLRASSEYRGAEVADVIHCVIVLLSGSVRVLLPGIEGKFPDTILALRSKLQRAAAEQTSNQPDAPKHIVFRLPHGKFPVTADSGDQRRRRWVNDNFLHRLIPGKLLQRLIILLIGMVTAGIEIWVFNNFTASAGIITYITIACAILFLKVKTILLSL